MQLALILPINEPHWLRETDPIHLNIRKHPEMVRHQDHDMHELLATYLVGGRCHYCDRGPYVERRQRDLQQCPGCKVACYCSVEHLLLDKQKHGQVCDILGRHFR